MRCLRLTAVALLLLNAIPVTAALVTRLEPRLIDELQTVRLIIRAVGSARAETPDLSPLETDFEVLGNQTSSRISSVNGRTVASVEYQISLRPKRTGELTVPSLMIGSERTEPIRLVVRPLDPAVRESIERMVFFETELSSNPVYVQAETVLVRRLFYSQGVQIYSDLPGIPDIADAVVLPLGETQARSVFREGRRYGVIEQRFAIFPERSGRLTIPAISVTSSVRLEAGGRTRRSGLRVTTEAMELTVQPIPAGYPADAAWLPATDVQMEQNWTPDLKRLEVGEPLNFEVRIRATGNRGSAIPPVSLSLSGDRFKIYPEAPAMEERTDGRTITGTRRERYALIPTTPGEVTPPPLTITWWDTRADELRQTRHPIEALTITGTATARAVPLTPDKSPRAESPARSGADSDTQADAWNHRRLISATVALLAFAAAIFLARRLRLRMPDRLSGPVRRPLERRQRLRALRAATRSADPVRYRRALADYLETAAADPPGDQPALLAFRHHAEAAPLLRALDEAVYAAGRPAGNAPRVDTGRLTSLAVAFVRQRNTARHDADALPALYG